MYTCSTMCTLHIKASNFVRKWITDSVRYNLIYIKFKNKNFYFTLPAMTSAASASMKPGTYKYLVWYTISKSFVFLLDNLHRHSFVYFSFNYVVINPFFIDSIKLIHVFFVLPWIRNRTVCVQLVDFAPYRNDQIRSLNWKQKSSIKSRLQQIRQKKNFFFGGKKLWWSINLLILILSIEYARRLLIIVADLPLDTMTM